MMPAKPKLPQIQKLDLTVSLQTGKPLVNRVPAFAMKLRSVSCWMPMTLAPHLVEILHCLSDETGVAFGVGYQDLDLDLFGVITQNANQFVVKFR